MKYIHTILAVGCLLLLSACGAVRKQLTNVKYVEVTLFTIAFALALAWLLFCPGMDAALDGDAGQPLEHCSLKPQPQECCGL